MTRLEFLTYVQDSGFKRTDKNDEIYTALDETLDELSTMELWHIQTERWYLSLVNGQYDYPLPSAMTLFMGDVRYLKDANTSWNLNKLTQSAFFRKHTPDLSTPNYGDPIDYCIKGNQVFIAPFIETVNSEVIEISGGEIQTRLTADDDEPDFKERWDEVIKHGVLYRLYLDLDEDTAMEKYLALYRDGINRMKKNDYSKHGTVTNIGYRDI